jgi:uncharacterized protein (TIGR02145 family)
MIIMKKIISIIVITFGFFQFTQAQSVTHQYDELNRLTQADYGNGTIIQYQYDKLGNRTQYVITGSATPPDLQPTALSLDNNTVSPGGEVLLTYTVNNLGQISAGQNVARFYINNNASLSGATEIDNRNFSSIIGGSGTQYTQVLTIPSNTASGSQFLLVDLDADEDVSESDENNNFENISLTIIDCPFLSISFPNISNESCEEENGSIEVMGSGGSAPYTYEWNTIPAQYTHIASNLRAGTFTVTLTDAFGCKAIASNSIINEGVDPVCAFNYSTSALTVDFTSLSTDATSYLWDFGDGNSSTQENPNHTYSGNGSYSVCLEAINNCDSDITCQTITVNDADYVEIESAQGVQLLKKQVVGDDPDFIQIIDLSAGAYIEFDHGDITSGEGTANPFFTREDIDDVWTEKTAMYNNVFSVTNGQFFNAGQSPSATLAFPVKQDGDMISNGYANTSEFIGEKEFLGIWAEHSNISPYNDDPLSIANSSALQGIVGLDKDANKGPNNLTGRTFAGVSDDNNDGTYEKVLIFTSESATQAYAAQQLNEMGVPFDKIVMLDGDGSTQMKCNGTDYVNQSRLLPQFIVVYSSERSVNDDCLNAISISCGETLSGNTENATIDKSVVFQEDFDNCSQPDGWILSAIDTLGNNVATSIGTCDGSFVFSFDCTTGYPSSGTPALGFSGCQAIMNANAMSDPQFMGTIYLTSPNIDLSYIGDSLTFDYENEAYASNGTFIVEGWNGGGWDTLFSRSFDSRGYQSISINEFSNADFKVRFSYTDKATQEWGAAIDNIMVTDQNGTVPCDPIDSPGEWYTFTGNGNVANLSTCGQAYFDTRLSVFSGDCNDLNCIAYNEDSYGCNIIDTNYPYTTKLSFPTTNGIDYYVLVHGWPGSSGEYDLYLSCSTPLPNDECFNAISLQVNPSGSCPDLSASGTTIGATSDSIPSGCGTSQYINQNNGVWYSFIAPSTEMVDIHLNTISGDHKMLVYHGTSCPGTLIDCTEESNLFVGGLIPGDLYNIMIWSLSGNEGDFSICISEISCSSTIDRIIPTIFESDTYFSGNMFNLTNNSDCVLQLSGFDINLDNVTTEVQVWYTTEASSYVGLEENESAWTMLGFDTITGNGPDNPTFLNVGGLLLSPGEQKGIYVASQTASTLYYTVGTGSNQFYTDGLLSIVTGVGKGFPNFNNQTYSPRVWNGKVYYNFQDICSLDVVNTNQYGNGSLNNAISCAESGDTIHLKPSIANDTIWVENSLLNLFNDLLIVADKLDSIVIASDTYNPIVKINAGVDLTLIGFTLYSRNPQNNKIIENDGLLTLEDMIMKSKFGDLAQFENFGNVEVLGDCRVIGRVPCGEPLMDERDGQIYSTVQIGGQCWMAENLNIGTFINSSTSQSDNNIIEKFCYNDDYAKCDTYGGLYQWNEMMQYTTIESTQGICPAGWHIPSDEEYKILEIALGMTQAQADSMYWRGTNQGSQIAGNNQLWNNGPLVQDPTFGSSGFNALPLGNFNGYIWTSTESGDHAWDRYLNYYETKISRNDAVNKSNDIYVRCVRDD